MSTSPKNATKMNEIFIFQAICWRSKYDAFTINPLGISCKFYDIKWEIVMLVFMFYRFVPIKIAFYRGFSRARTICWWYCISIGCNRFGAIANKYNCGQIYAPNRSTSSFHLMIWFPHQEPERANISSHGFAWAMN